MSESRYRLVGGTHHGEVMVVPEYLMDLKLVKKRTLVPADSSQWTEPAIEVEVYTKRKALLWYVPHIYFAHKGLGDETALGKYGELL